MQKKLKALLEKLELDYNHPWPNEDAATKIYRLKTLIEIREMIYALGL